MVLVKRLCPPERRRAVIAVSASTSATEVSISKSSEFQLIISLRIAWTTQPGRPITISRKGTVFAQSVPDSTVDTLARGTVSLVSASNPERRINLGMFRTNDISGHGGGEPQPADLKERPSAQLLTIPAKGEVDLTHNFTIGRVFQYEENIKPQDVIGEKWRIGLHDGYLGTTWWCWGDLDSDLEESKLSGWHEGVRSEYGAQKPDVTELESGRWVAGFDPRTLVFEHQKPVASFRFVD